MEDDILITPTNESIEDVTKKEQIVEFQDMDNFINNSDATDETIVVKEKYVEEENAPTQVNIESVKKKNIDYYFIINIVIFLAICIVLLTGILNANNIRVRIAKKYCNYLKTSDLKKLENYVIKNTDYYIIDTGEELNKEDINLLNRQNLFDKKITKAYKVLINYKLNSQEDNFENKKSLVIVKVDNSWKLLNPNNYN